MVVQENSRIFLSDDIDRNRPADGNSLDVVHLDRSGIGEVLFDHTPRLKNLELMRDLSSHSVLLRTRIKNDGCQQPPSCLNDPHTSLENLEDIRSILMVVE